MAVAGVARAVAGRGISRVLHRLARARGQHETNGQSADRLNRSFHRCIPLSDFVENGGQRCPFQRCHAVNHSATSNPRSGMAIPVSGEVGLVAGARSQPPSRTEQERPGTVSTAPFRKGTLSIRTALSLWAGPVACQSMLLSPKFPILRRCEPFTVPNTGGRAAKCLPCGDLSRSIYADSGSRQ